MTEVVITGIGLACPLGLGREAVWSAVERGESGVRQLPWLKEAKFPIPIGGEVPDFEPKQYVKPRKSLKVMCRETQLAFAAAELACQDAGLDQSAPDPERLGVVVGTNVYRSELPEIQELYRKAQVEGEFDFSRWGEAMKELYPLWMLKYLPNMAACHVGIYRDARGPNNTIVEGDVSGLLAIIEAHDVIARGHADVMLTGATSTMLTWIDLLWHKGSRMSRQIENPASACRPFDNHRDGMVCSEGAGIFVLESRQHAEQRGAKVLGRVLGYGRSAEPAAETRRPTGRAIRNSIEAALRSSGLSADELSHVNAHGVATKLEDAVEAQAIRQILGDLPVTAPKSFLGNIGAGGGAVELAISLLASERNQVPATMNYTEPDPECPVNVVTTPQVAASPNFIALSHKVSGQAAAVVVGAEGSSA